MTNLRFDQIMTITLAIISLFAGFFGRLSLRLLPQRMKEQMSALRSADSPRIIVMIAIVVGITVGGSFFLTELVMFSQHTTTLQVRALRALVMAALVTVGYCIGYFIATKLLYKAKQRD